MKTHTSLKLSKLFAENGCELESSSYWVKDNDLPDNILEFALVPDPKFDWDIRIPAYDILNDLCVTHAKEVFGEERIEKEYPEWAYDMPVDPEEVTAEGDEDFTEPAYEVRAYSVMKLLQQGKQEEAEQYLWEHCLFNPKNK